MTRLRLDCRALSTYRIALGSLLLFDLARWFKDFPFFLSPGGPLPLGSLVEDSAGGAQAWSVYNGSCYGLYPYMLFLVTALAAVALTVGWRSRGACVVLLPLLMSLQNRAAIALDQADIVELACLLTGVLLPWDQVLSIKPSPPMADRVALWAPGAVLLLQALLWQEQALEAWSGGASAWWTVTLALSPLPILAFGGDLRFLALLVPAAAFLTRLPANELLPWLGLIGLLPWIGAELVRPNTSRRARWGMAFLFLILTAGSVALGHAIAASPELAQGRAFLALGPRAPSPSANGWLAFVARAPKGEKDWNGLDPTRPVSFARPEHPFATDSYRQSLYLGSLESQGNWGLRYWLAYSFYNRERRRLGPAGPTRIEIYRCVEAPGAPASSVLFSRWPMQD